MSDTPVRSYRPRPGGAGIYYADEGGSLNLHAGFLPTPAPAPAPAAISLAETWSTHPGIFLFLGRPAQREARFRAELAALLADPAYGGAGVIWIDDPAAPPETWLVYTLRPERRGAVGALGAAAFFAFGSYGLVVQHGGAVRLEPERPALVVEPPPGSPFTAFLTIRQGTTKLPYSAGPLRVVLGGPAAGRLELALTVPAGAPRDLPGVDLLDIGLRYFYLDPRFPVLGRVSSQRYPIFDTSATPLRLLASLDPLRPLEGPRSSIAFTAGQVIPSFFRTNLGRRLALVPDDARLVFAPRPLRHAPDERAPFYLVPDGSFTVRPMEEEQQRFDLLCGTAGTEYFGVVGNGTIRFIPGRPAFAPTFRPDLAEDTAGAGDGPPPLDAFATTAWVQVAGDTRLTYYAQPVGAELFMSNNGSPILSYREAQAGEVPPLDDPVDAVFPMVPYAGLSGGLAPSARLEQRVLAPFRRRLIYAISQELPPLLGAAAADDAEETCATPQGLLGRFRDNMREWLSLTLARQSGKELSFDQIAEPLRSALLTSQQFLVISNATQIRKFFATNTAVGVAGWDFDLHPDRWRASETMIVIKNFPRSLDELAADSSRWVLPREFNADPADASARLQAMVKAARKRARNDDGSVRDGDLLFFAETVASDPGWNGILFLNIPLPLEALPSALAGLAAGIDPARFSAHHLGISQAPLDPLVPPPDSSFFGLISYPPNGEPDPAPGEGGGDYDFQVLRLQTRFVNSQPVSFSAQIALAVRRLFQAVADREVAPGTLAPDDNLILEGAMQRQGGAAAYSFALPSEVSYKLDDLVLPRVRIARAEFLTVSDGSTGTPPGTVQARFDLAGSLEFVAALKDMEGKACDLFSYSALAFSGLAVRMAFPAATPAARTLTFAPDDVRFDGDRSTVRESSLARHFPLKITRLLAGTEQKGLGLIPLDHPVDAQDVSAPWYALAFDLNLGTPGALAADIGFTAEMAVAWSPFTGTSQPRVSVGLKLPRASGKRNEISIMGLLKLKMRRLQLVRTEREPGNPTTTSFQILMNGVTLNLFSKSLPPGASFDFILFGPDDEATVDTLGWYAAYVKEASPTPQK